MEGESEKVREKTGEGGRSKEKGNERKEGEKKRGGREREKEGKIKKCHERFIDDNSHLRVTIRY